MSTLQRQKGAVRRAAPRARLGPVVVGCVLLAAGTLLLREAIVAANEFGLTVDGPRLAPVVVAGGWTVLAAAYLVRQLTRRPGHNAETNHNVETDQDAETDHNAETDHGASSWRTPAMLVAALVAYVLALEPVGFVPATAVFFVGAARILGSTRLVRDVVVAVPLALVVYLAFTRILEIQLPRGVLGL
ncbi:MAG TPA: tripartite tricarboxylate transporter TctB family protein [Pilimelia sp.]|nr:tripartite tricarboxylate transporter TctB family protein [Pilimelia sp.]